MARRYHPAWRHAYTVDGDPRIHCTYCGHRVSGICRFAEHLAGVGVDTKHCSLVPQPVHEEFQEYLACRLQCARRPSRRALPFPKHGQSSSSSTAPAASSRLSRRAVVDTVRTFFIEHNIPSMAVQTPSFVNMINVLCAQPRPPIPTSVEIEFRVVKPEEPLQSNGFLSDQFGSDEFSPSDSA